MALYMIGLGLWDEKDISIKGLEAVKKCDFVYLETYTSRLSSPVAELEKLYGRTIILADRDMVESKADDILAKAKQGDCAFLVIGDVFGATTHTDLRLRAIENGITVRVIHNASVLNAIGITGLELYKFGKITSIPFHNENVASPVEAMKQNQKTGLHTLFLFDLSPKDDEYMTISEAVSYLMRCGVDKGTKAVGCAGLGSENPEICYAKLSALQDKTFTLLPQCLIIPGNLHFIEEEALESWK